MKVRVERAWIRVVDTAGVEKYQVVVRVDAMKGQFLESVHADRESAEGRIWELQKSVPRGLVLDAAGLTPTR